jgi:flagellar basal body-associated protein FliL
MNTFFSLIKKWFGKKGSGPRDPGQDWLLLLVVGIVFLVVSVVWNVWFFSSVVTEEVSQAHNASNALGTYDAGAVKEIFEARASSSEAYRSLHVFVDPVR